jgi:hypothetical protein
VIAVAVVHTEVAQLVLLMATVTVVSNTPKFMPRSVALDPPLTGPFQPFTCVVTGASNVNADIRVPTKTVKMTYAGKLAPVPGAVVHVIDDSDVHVVV